MVRAMRAIHLVCATAILGLGAACAPVQTKTHFDRWEEYSAKIAAEEAAEEAKKKGMAPAASPAPAPAAQPAAAPAAAPVYGTSTPPVTRTSTGSRVIRPGSTPAGGDEDVIY